MGFAFGLLIPIPTLDEILYTRAVLAENLNVLFFFNWKGHDISLHVPSVTTCAFYEICNLQLCFTR